MADCERPVPADAEVVLELRGVGRGSGRVVWSKDGKIGIAFDHEIDPALARKPVASGATHRAPSYLRLHQIGR